MSITGVLRFISRRILYVAIVLVILLAIVVAVARSLTPILNKYQAQITYFASQKLQKPVTIAHIDGTWHWLQPTIKLKKVQILQPDSTQPILQIQELVLGIDLFKSLLHWQVKLGTVLIHGTKVTLIQQADRQWQLQGFTSTQPSNKQQNLLEPLFDLGHAGLKDVDIVFEPLQKTPIKLNNINVDLLSFGQRHYVDGQLDLIRQTKLPLEFSAQIRGKASAAEKLKTHFHLITPQFNLNDWAALLPASAPQISGSLIDVDLHGTSKGKLLTMLQASFVGKNLKINTPYLTKALTLDFLTADMTFKHPTKQLWSLHLNQGQSQNNSTLLPPNTAAVKINYQDKTHFTINAQLDHLPLSTQLPFSLAALPEQDKEILRRLQPNGEVQQIQVQFDRNANQADQYVLQANLHDLSWQAWETIPGMTTVNGQIKLTNHHGEANLNGTGTVANFPLVFRKPISLQTWQSAVSWAQQKDGLHINTNATEIVTEAGDAQNKLSLWFPADDSSPVINLTSTVHFKQLTQDNIYHYLPTGILPTTVVSWLDQNILGLGTTDATLSLKGPLVDFPFDQSKNGEFIIKAQFNDANLNLSPGWPAAHQVAGTMLFSGASMDIQANQGEIDGAKIIKAEASIPYMGAASPVVLNIQGQAAADASQVLTFLHQSPLQAYLQQGLNTAQGSGPVNVNLQLAIPLAQDTDAPTVKGEANLQNINLHFPAWYFSLNQVKGILNFSEQGLAADNINATLLGAPFNLSIIPASNNNQPMQIRFNTLVSLATLEATYGLPLSMFANGQTAISGNIAIATNKTVNLTINSDLKGIQINLPMLLKKNPQQTVPLKIQASLPSPQTPQLSFTYGKEAAGNFQFNASPNFKLKAGNIILGTSALPALPKQGLNITGNLPVCSTAVWQQTLVKLKPLRKQSSVPAEWPTWLNAAVVNCQQLLLGSFSFPQAQLSVQPENQGWSVSLNSAQAKGKVLLPAKNSSQPIQINFNQLYLQTIAKTASTMAVNPANLPAVQFSVNDLRYANKRIGQVKGSLQPQKIGAAINANITQPGIMSAQLQTQWRAVPASTQLMLNIKSQNVSQFLANMQMPSNLKSQNAQTTVNLYWAGAPYQFPMNRLNGSISLQIFDGLIDGLDKNTTAKIGFGRLLNVLSLQSLPDRLKGSFSNVGKSGFNFSKMLGQFQINNGIATINQGSVASPIADINLSGTINCVNQTYNMVMAVTPHLTSSAPIAATLFGGPIVGVAVWAANEVLSPAVNAITKNQYKVTGSWTNPVMTKM